MKIWQDLGFIGLGAVYPLLTKNVELGMIIVLRSVFVHIG